jgi:hypothetical protein
MPLDQFAQIDGFHFGLGNALAVILLKIPIDPPFFKGGSYFFHTWGGQKAMAMTVYEAIKITL